jgi:hypothetical protein
VSLRPEVDLTEGVKPTVTRGAQSESFTDKMWTKRKDMMKVVVMVLMITAALATHSVLSDFLGEYISSAYLSTGGERVAKLCYPASVLAAVWVLKISHK